MSARATVQFRVAEHESGERLDRILAARGIGASRAEIQRWMREGSVAVDGKTADPSSRPRAGASVEVVPLAPPRSDVKPEPIALRIVHEDEALLVIDKPAGLVVHPAPGHLGGTLVNALLHHVKTLAASDDARRPGIVHRIDKGTSGLLVVAKTTDAREHLAAQFHAHTVERRYVAIALGHVASSRTFHTFHARHPTDRKRFTSRATSGRRAVTHVRLLERLHGASLVACELETGRTHQIRVHLAEHGHPLLGDATYGRRALRDPRLVEAQRLLGRPALHAETLGFEHPTSREWMRFVSPWPADFESARSVLRLGETRAAT